MCSSEQQKRDSYFKKIEDLDQHLWLFCKFYTYPEACADFYLTDQYAQVHTYTRKHT